MSLSLYRIYALIQRYWIVGFRESSRFFHLFYFPILDIVLWGYMSLWMYQRAEGAVNFMLIYLAAIVLWDIIWAINNEQSLNLLEELQSRNIVNLFATPVTLLEWIIAGAILGISKALITLFFGASVVWLFYGINIFSIGCPIMLFVISIIVSGLALGFFLNGILIRGGRQIAILIWSIPYLLLTFSAVFYPLALLPKWVQYCAMALPTTYVFEALRYFVEHGSMPHYSMIISFLLNVGYVISSILFFMYMFNRSKTEGLAQLEEA